MSSCERCWRDAAGDPDRYQRLIRSPKDCTPEQQAGRDAGWCSVCRVRAVHEITRECMACGVWQ